MSHNEYLPSMALYQKKRGNASHYWERNKSYSIKKDLKFVFYSLSLTLKRQIPPIVQNSHLEGR